jgi:hypothetical protein
MSKPNFQSYQKFSHGLSQRALRAVIDKRIELQIKEFKESESRKLRRIQEIETEERIRNITYPNLIQKRIQTLLTARDQALTERNLEKLSIIFTELKHLIDKEMTIN